MYLLDTSYSITDDGSETFDIIKLDEENMTTPEICITKNFTPIENKDLIRFVSIERNAGLIFFNFISNKYIVANK
jgi:hypothetical protein